MLGKFYFAGALLASITLPAIADDVHRVSLLADVIGMSPGKFTIGDETFTVKSSSQVFTMDRPQSDNPSSWVLSIQEIAPCQFSVHDQLFSLVETPPKPIDSGFSWVIDFNLVTDMNFSINSDEWVDYSIIGVKNFIEVFPAGGDAYAATVEELKSNTVPSQLDPSQLDLAFTKLKEACRQARSS